MKTRFLFLAMICLALSSAAADIIKDFHNIETQYQKLCKKNPTLSDKYLSEETCKLFRKEIDETKSKAWFSESEENIAKALREHHSNGFSPVFYAIDKKDLKLLEDFEKFGGDFNEKISGEKRTFGSFIGGKVQFENVSTMLFACIVNDKAVMDFFLDNRCSNFDAQGMVISTTKMSLSPVQYLTNFYNSRNFNIIRKLVEKGSDVDCVFSIGDETKTAAFCGIFSKDSELSDLMIKQLSPKKIDTKVTVKTSVPCGEKNRQFSGFFTGTLLSYACAHYNFDRNEITSELIENLIFKGANVENKCFYGNNEVTPLLLICMNSDIQNSCVDMAEKLIYLNADMETVCKLDDWIMTPFHFVSKFAGNQTGDLYLKFSALGADMNKKDNKGKSAFDYIGMNMKNSADKVEFWYMKKKHFNIEEFSSEFGYLDYSEKTTNGDRSILQVIIENKDEETAIEYLKNNYVNWKETDIFGKNAFDSAVEARTSHILNYFLENNIYIGKSIFTLIEYAMESGDMEYLQKFLDSQEFKAVTKKLSKVNINANITEEAGPVVYTALTQATIEKKSIAKNRNKVIEKLLSHSNKISDAGINSRVITGGKTPILYVVENAVDGELAAAEETAIHLLNYGANLDIKDNEGSSAKLVSFRKNMSLVLKWMLENKVQLGDAIFAAIDNELDGHNSYLAEFLKNDKSSTVQRNGVYTPMTYCAAKNLNEFKSENRIRILKTLIENGFSIDEKISGGEQNGETAFLISAKAGNHEVAKFLMENGANLDAENNGYEPGKTAVFYAFESGNSKMVEEIIYSPEFKCRDIQLKNQTTFLMYLARYGNFNEVNALLPKLVAANSNSLERRDNEGMTPFLYAACYNEDYRILSLLRMYGANVNATDKNGNNARVLAENNKNAETIISRLENYGVYK